MAIKAILIEALAAPLAKLLTERWFGVVAGEIGGTWIDLLKGRIKDFEEGREARRILERTADRIVTRLVPLFEQELKSGEFSVEAVANELKTTLETQASAESLVKGDLDPQEVAKAFRQARKIDPLIGTRETELYNRALDETVRYLTGVASKLSGYEEALAAESLRRLSLALADTAKILDGIDRIKSGVDSLNPEKRFGDFEKSYRQVAMTELDYLELYGAGLSESAKHHPLHVGYISLGLQEDGDADADADDSGPIPVDAVFDRMKPNCDKLFIVGEAGSGKSTIMRWAAMTAAGFTGFRYIKTAAFRLGHFELPVDDLVEPEKLQLRPDGLIVADAIITTNYDDLTTRALLSYFRWRDRVPFLIRLRDCDGGRLPPIEEWADRLRREGMLGKTPEGWVESVLRDRRAIVLIDGVDEVAREHREDVHRDIAAFLRQWEGNCCVVTTRPAAVEHGWLKTLGFQEVRIAPMSDADRNRFIDHWYEAVVEAAAIAGTETGKAKELAASLKQKLADTPELARLATNPLLGAMICALHRDLNKVLPRRPHGVVEELCKVLLQRDELTGMGSAHVPKAYAALDEDQRKDIVQDLAVAMVRASRSSLDRTAIIPTIEQRLREVSGRVTQEADEILLALIERSGILKIARQASTSAATNRPQTVEFNHNTFRDYLAARHFAQDGSDDALQFLPSLWEKDRSFDTVLLFAVAVPGKQGFATRLVEQFVPASEPAPTQCKRRKQRSIEDHARRFMAVRLRASATYLDPDLTTRVDTIAWEMFPPRNMSDAEALAVMGDLALPFLPDMPPPNQRHAAATARLLRLIGTERARGRLQAYLKEKRLSVLIELAQAVEPLTLTAVRKMVASTKELPDAIRSQIRDLTPLAGLTTPQILDLNETEISDMSLLAELASLRYLRLSKTQVSDLGPLAKLTSLRYLHLSETQVSDLSPLAKLTSLQHLDVSGTQVSNLGPLNELTRLQSLYLHGTQVSDLGPLNELTRLQSLYLHGTQVSDLGPLTGLTSLQYLRLNQTQISDLGPLAELTSLQELFLSRTQVSDLSPLAGTTNLRYLALNQTKVTSLAPLVALPRLRFVWIGGLQVADRASFEALNNRGILRGDAVQSMRSQEVSGPEQ